MNGKFQKFHQKNLLADFGLDFCLIAWLDPMYEPSLGLTSQALGTPIPGVDIYWDHVLGLLAFCL